jgi:hypothetical protein
VSDVDFAHLLTPCKTCGKPLLAGVEDEACHCCFGCNVRDEWIKELSDALELAASALYQAAANANDCTASGIKDPIGYAILTGVADKCRDVLGRVK